MIASLKSTNRSVLALLFGMLVLPSTQIRSQPSSPDLPENRFLLIVETSHAMEKRAAGLAGAIDQLLRSGIQGQARPGDTIGFWTYNDSLHAGEFPLKTWYKDAGKNISKDMLTFLADQKLSKQPHFDCVTPTLEPVVKNSPFITVVVITSGADPIKGTPFDKDLNKAVARWRDEQQKARMPIVVVLRAAAGTFTHYTVTPAPWQVEMPPLPTELTAVKPRKPTTPIAPAPPPSPVPSLIVSGKRTPPASSLPVAPVPLQSTNAPLLPTNSEPTMIASTTNSPPVTASVPAAPVELSPIPTLIVHARETAPSAAATQPANEAVALPAAHGALTPKILTFGGLLLAAVCALVLFGHSRQNHVSLITHSINHKRP